MHSKLEEFYNEQNQYPNTFTAATFPGIDAESLKDPKGQSVTINAAVADQAAAQAVAAPTTTSASNYLYIPYNCTGTTSTDCAGYVLKSFVEKPGGTTTNPYVKLGLNNN
jgi:mannose-1-phosphate guanylyltransferase